MLERRSKNLGQAIRHHRKTIALSFLGLGIAVFFAWRAGVTETALRPANVEEKELLLATLDRLEDKGPQVAILRDKLQANSVTIWVTDEKGIALKEEGLQVDSEFFEADPLEQEKQILGFLNIKNESRDQEGIALDKDSQ